MSMSSSTAPRLLGPPVARLFSADAPPPPPHADETRPVPDLAALQGTVNTNWATYANPCLDLFLAGADTPPHRLRELLEAAWECDARTALKLVCNLRGVRGTGKADREGFYTAALWMHQYHPRTLACNLPALADFGYIKDFPELLYRLINGPDVRKEAKAKAAAWAGQGQRQGRRKRARSDNGPIPSTTAMPSSKRTTSIKPGAVEEYSGPEEKEAEAEAEAAASKNKVARLAQLALRRYRDDPTYAFLFNSIADFFADRLRSDVDKLGSGKAHEIGLAAKWCPSLDSSFDQATLLCEAIARRLFPVDEAFHARKRLRREVLVPLRGALKLPEVFMCQNRWSDLPYNRVASVAMKRYEALFMKHDPARFEAFKTSRDAKIAAAAGALPTAGIAAAGAPLPHKVITASMASEVGPVNWRRIVLWRAVVNHHSSKGHLCNCLAVCDVSPSMRGVRLDVCVALGLLISELSEHPWKDCVHPFSEDPQLHSIAAGRDIKDRIRRLLGVRVHCADRIDLRAVFKSIRRAAKIANVRPEKMIRTIFVLTDKEFNEASATASRWKADYRIMADKFRSQGFRFVPQVVFWNLRGPRSAALTSHSDGVLKLSGFSDRFFELFLEKDGVVMPEDEMDAAIAGHDYKKPLVFD